jgi:hypothetical protein
MLKRIKLHVSKDPRGDAAGGDSGSISEGQSGREEQGGEPWLGWR